MKRIARGSLKHVQDLVSRQDFLAVMNRLLVDSGSTVVANDAFHPNASDFREFELSEFGPRYLPKAIDWPEFNRWWPTPTSEDRPWRTPNWDLLSTCSFGATKGLVLVEAKANEAELKHEGKSLSTKASEKSKDNHRRIGDCIREASIDLSKRVPGVNLSLDICYQLANRISFAWKLASCGLPVVLIYLGFLKDTGITDAGPFFRDHSHWLKTMQGHMKGVVPDGFLNTRIELAGGGSMIMFIRSLDIVSVSPPGM